MSNFPYLLSVWSLVIGILLLLLVYFAGSMLVIWFMQRRFTRERFAFQGLSAIFSLTLLIFVSMGARSTPWRVIANLMESMTGREFVNDAPSMAENILLILILIIVSSFILRIHKQWGGAKSIEQYNSEQRSESPSLIGEGLNEVKRIVKREEPRKMYQATSSLDYLNLLQPLTDSLAWKDQARELIGLTSSSYDFNPDGGWHDNVGYWEGMNVDTKKKVFLYPAQEGVTEKDLSRFVEYSGQFKDSESNKHPEIMVAVRGEESPKSQIVNGITIQIESESHLLDNLIDMKDYRNEISKRVSMNPFQDSGFVIEDVYVPSAITTSDL